MRPKLRVVGDGEDPEQRRREEIATVVEDLDVAHGMVTEARATADEYGTPLLRAALTKADDAITAASAQAKRERS